MIRAVALTGSVLLGFVPGCVGERPPPPQMSPTLLSEPDRLLRVSMAIRGVRPSPSDHQRFFDGSATLETLVDEWLEDPRFGETVKDLWAEALLIRADTEPILLSQGPLLDVSSERIFDAMSESALRLIEDVVVNDRPFTEIVTADYLWANDVLHLMYGVPYDPAGETWQQTVWGDERPTAGILSDNGLWMRYPSNGSNFHRGRANVVSATLLCDDFNLRDISVDGGIDLSDEQAVADAVTRLPNCVGCHQALEPMATFFWGFRQDNLRTATFRAYFRFDCEGESADYCYPIKFYKPELEDDWIDFGLQPPAYFGQPGETLVDLGQFVADDPRFAECTARRFQAYLTQSELDEVPQAVVSPLQQHFVDSGYDVKALVREIVLSEAFSVDTSRTPPEALPPATAGLQTLRPEQYARTVLDLTGFDFRGNPGCSFDGCFDRIHLGTTDRFGFRSMSGGVDGLQVTRPTHTPTPTKVMFMAYYASEAAGYAVKADAFAEPGQRRVLWVTGALEGEPDAVRTQIANLHARFLGEFRDPSDPEIERTVQLYQRRIDRGGSPEDAWRVVLTALLQDNRMLFY